MPTAPIPGREKATTLSLAAKKQCGEPKFIRDYADLRARRFPGPEHSCEISDEEMGSFLRGPRMKTRKWHMAN